MALSQRCRPKLSTFLLYRQFPTCCLRNISNNVPDVSEEHHGHSPSSQPAREGVRRQKSHMYRQTIFSGIQPTGIPHLGNYLGALRQWKEFQDQKINHPKSKNHRMIYSIVDLHALTHWQNPEELRRRRQETVASLLAIGLDPQYCQIYFQSQVPAHTQLMWYLSNAASAGYLSRMTQWKKSKLGVSDNATLEDQVAIEKLRLGLFSYPVLQAADILLFGTNIVPVGEDQTQHIEFTRRLARSFNAQYREFNEGRDIFVIPNVFISPAKRIMSLKDPTTKMSKSHTDPNSRILITDSPDEIRAKIKTALTDSIKGISYDTASRPGVSNLIEILKHVTGTDRSCEEIANDNAQLSMRAFKEHVAEETIKALGSIRERFLKLMEPDNDEIRQALQTSTRIVSALAGDRLRKIENVMGISWNSKPQNKPSKDEERHQVNQEELEKKNAVIREQEQIERDVNDEPDVTPQHAEGVDRPIAS